MGFLGDLLGKAAKDTLSKVAKDVVSGVSGLDPDLARLRNSDNTNRPVAASDNRSFDEKFSQIILSLGYELERNVSPDRLEQEFGLEIYKRGGNRCAPDSFTYMVCQNGNRVAYVRLWDYYTDYNHVANRDIWDFCHSNNICCLDFFDYLPNEYDYMEQRIRSALSA